MFARTIVFTGSLLLLNTTAGAAQNGATASREGKRPLLPAAEEIALARTAAPASVADSATIYVLTDTAYVAAVRGTSGASCYIDRSWNLALEPQCFDAEGSATVMRIHMRKTVLLHRGVSYAEAERQVGAELAEGKLRLPRRPAMSYMMSAEQKLYNDSGVAVGAWQPHIMVYYPYLSTSDLGMRVPDLSAAVVSNEGEATSSIVVVVKNAIKRAR